MRNGAVRPGNSVVSSSGCGATVAVATSGGGGVGGPPAPGFPQPAERPAARQIAAKVGRERRTIFMGISFWQVGVSKGCGRRAARRHSGT